MEVTRQALKGAKRFAIMGGTFNPPHYGHLAAAEEARARLELDAVIFMPAGIPAFKRAQTVSHKEHRYAMTLLAAETNPFFHASRMEIDREGVTYTVDTVRELREICSADAKIYFITGADAFGEVSAWKEAEALFGLCGFIVATRPGYDAKRLSEAVESAKAKFHGDIYVLDIPALDISSSGIRGRIAAGLPVKYLLPPEVERYISKNGLYKDALTKPLTEVIIDKIRKTQTEKRFKHTLDVAETAKKLAAHYGEDTEKAYVAGLLHDMAKGIAKEELFEKAGEYGIEADATDAIAASVLHGYLAAEMAVRDLNIKDADILNAVRYHTTGRRNMSLLEKIIYTADYTEPSRESEWAERARALAFADIDAAVMTAIRGKLEHVKAKNKEIHPLSLEALEYIEYHYQNNKEDF